MLEGSSINKEPAAIQCYERMEELNARALNLLSRLSSMSLSIAGPTSGPSNPTAPAEEPARNFLGMVNQQTNKLWGTLSEMENHIVWLESNFPQPLPPLPLQGQAR